MKGENIITDADRREYDDRIRQANRERQNRAEAAESTDNVKGVSLGAIPQGT